MTENASDGRDLRDAFFAGLYASVLERSIDGPSFAYEDDDTPYVVGSLAFVGRIEEAAAALRSWERRRPATALRAAARFFLAIAHGRAGRHGSALHLVLENVRERGKRGERCERGQGRNADPIQRFYVHQGIACLRYFEGRMERAAKHALVALEAAFDGKFQYGRLLATDLRGHALIQVGDVRAGLVLLDQARTLASRLRLDGNAGAIACAMTIYAARFGTRPITDCIAELEMLVASAPAQDSYSRRSVQMELSCQYALAGRGDAAWSILDGLASEPLPDGDHRSRVRMLLAFAFVANLRYGGTSAEPYAVEARRSLDGRNDVGLEIEVLAGELAAAESLRESPPDDSARPQTAHDARATRRVRLDRLAALHRLTRIARAKSAFERHSETADAEESAEAACLEAEKPASMLDDRAEAMFCAATRGFAGAPMRLVKEGYLGLVPRALGLSPGQRLWLTAPTSLLVEEHGNVRAHVDVSEGSLRLLRALGESLHGPRGLRERKDKEALVREVWKLGSYRPERHDSLVHTAISRLRAALGSAGHWVEGEEGGYRLAADVELVDLTREGRAIEGEVLDEGRAPAAIADQRPRSESPNSDAQRPDAESAERAQLATLLTTLHERTAMSTGEMARALGISEMTAFRRIRTLLEQGAVVRSGRGRSTKYVVTPPPPPGNAPPVTPETTSC